MRLHCITAFTLSVGVLHAYLKLCLFRFSWGPDVLSYWRSPDTPIHSRK